MTELACQSCGAMPHIIFTGRPGFRLSCLHGPDCTQSHREPTGDDAYFDSAIAAADAWREIHPTEKDASR